MKKNTTSIYTVLTIDQRSDEPFHNVTAFAFTSMEKALEFAKKDAVEALQEDGVPSLDIEEEIQKLKSALAEDEIYLSEDYFFGYRIDEIELN